MENDDLKKQADLTDLFVKFANKIKIDDKDIPKTEKGLATKAKELIESLGKKIEKVSDEELNVYIVKKKIEKRKIEKNKED